MENKPIYPRLIRVKVKNPEFAYADLELAPGLEIRNLLYASVQPGTTVQVWIPLLVTPSFLFKEVDIKRYSRATVELPGALKKWIAEEFEIEIGKEMARQGRAYERRRKRKQGEPFPPGYVSVVDSLTRIGISEQAEGEQSSIPDPEATEGRSDA